MKLTFFGLTISSSWGNGHATLYRALLRALHRQGHRVVFYEKDVNYYARRRDCSWLPYGDLVFYQDWDQVRALAMDDARSSDVVVVASYCPDGARISDEMLSLSRPLRVFYDLDTPITLADLCRSGGLDYLRPDQIREFDLYLSFTGGPILHELERIWGARCARPLYGCVDADVYHRVEPRLDFQSDLSYMGTYSPDRQTKLEELLFSPARSLPRYDFLLAGSLYPAAIDWPANVHVLEHVAPSEHPALYSSSRLTLNITRQGMARYGFCPSGRFFEAAACGTPLVSDWFDGLETFFHPRHELFVVNTAEEVMDAVTASDEQLGCKAQLARERTLAEHSGTRRAQQFLAFCEEARSARVTSFEPDKLARVA